MSYETWAEPCFECGARPTREDYISYLEDRAADLKKLQAMTPEEFTRWYEDYYRMAVIVEEAILTEVRAPRGIGSFKRVAKEVAE